MENTKPRVPQEIELSLIKPGRYANRLSDDDKQLAELAESIREIGLLEPISVVAGGGQYTIVSGHRRRRACELAGMMQVECYIEVRSDQDIRRVVIAANEMRANLTPIERAEQIRRWIEEDGLTESAVARIHHRSEDWVRRQRALLTWPMDVLEQIHVGTISMASGANLAQVTDDEYRKFLVRTASENGASARTTQAWLIGWQSQRPPEEAIEQEPAESTYVPYRPAPELPCLICAEIRPPEELSSVLICPGCLSTLRQAYRR